MSPTIPFETQGTPFAAFMGEHARLWSNDGIQHGEVTIFTCNKLMFDIFTCISLNYRCENFNGVMREHNLHSNRHASSRDIAERFSIMEQANFLCHQGVVPSDHTVRYPTENT